MESGVSGYQRTRSQVAPDWTSKDALILLNEIAAVETDCANALSSYQKWKIISENCNAMDVHRTSNQCRRKWDSLLEEYNKIKQWESCLEGGSYWSLGIERRKRLKLPGNFDKELFEAVDAVVKVQEDRAGTEPDSDPEAEAGTDMLDIIVEQGPKRPRQWSGYQTEEKPQEHGEAANLKKSPVEEKLLASSTDEERTMSMEEEADIMAVKLRENARLIHAIVNGNLAEGDNIGTARNQLGAAEVVRCEGDRLIVCLGEIVNAFNRFSRLAKEWD